MARWQFFNGIAVAALLVYSLSVHAQAQCVCQDKQPPGDVPCHKQKEFGKCDRYWMVHGGYCNSTCGRCNCEVVNAPCDCNDDPPNSDFTCQQQKEFGKCDLDWMQGSCEITCGRCKCDHSEPPAEVNRPEAPENKSPQGQPSTDETAPPAAAKRETGTCPNSLMATLESNAELSTLVKALNATDLTEELSKPDLAVTLFAPNNEAFKTLLADFRMTLEGFLGANVDTVKAVLQYHIVPQIVDRKSLTHDRTFETQLSGKVLFGGRRKNEIEALATSAGIVGDPVDVCSSRLYVVNAVLLPAPSLEAISPTEAEPAEQDEDQQKQPKQQEQGPVSCNPQISLMFAVNNDPDLEFLTEALTRSGLATSLAELDRNYTVFGPTDKAFADLLATLQTSKEEFLNDKDRLLDILNYHVVGGKLAGRNLTQGSLKTLDGKPIFVEVTEHRIELGGVGSSARILDVDIDQSCKSSLHKIDRVLLPFSVKPAPPAPKLSDATSPAEAPSDRKCKSMADVIGEHEELRVLNRAALLAGLMPVLADTTQKVTLFAPTDDAFFALLGPDVEGKDILDDPDSLISILSYHAVSKPLPFGKLKKGQKLPTLVASKGKPLTLKVVTDSASPLDLGVEGVVGKAGITEEDISACDSVIHLIDSVLLPVEEASFNKQPGANQRKLIKNKKPESNLKQKRRDRDAASGR